MDLKRYGEQLRTLRRQTGLSQEQLADALTKLAQSGPTDEFRVVDGTLISRSESAREHKGRQWKPTRAYVLYLLRLFSDYLDVEAAHTWAAQADYQLSLPELRELFPTTASIAAPTSLGPPLQQPTLQPSAPPYNIPSALTSFIGREVEIALLTHHFQSAVPRLVTIVGEGGVGKTRLALAFAQSILAQRQPSAVPDTELAPTIPTEPSFTDGIWFVPLAGLNPREVTSSANQLATAIAETIGFALARTDLEPSDQLLHFMRSRVQLLILDNFEHLMHGTVYLLELLQQAPQLRVLVTSRMPLNCQAERVLKLQGLAFPKADQPAQQSSQAEFDLPCVQLFVERARQQSADLSLPESSLQAVCRLCRLVNGNPLAIELAAHWIQHYTVEEIADVLEPHERLRQEHSLLVTDQQDVPLRHRSMEAIFETSWELLSPDARRFLAMLSVVRGTLSLEAAWAVAGTSPWDLADLVNRSLLHVQHESPGGRSYVMHELLRQFAFAKLIALDSSQPEVGQPEMVQLAHKRHCDYYLDFLAVRTEALHGRSVKDAVSEIRVVIDNVRAAWHWAVHQHEVELVAHAWQGLRTFYHVRSLFQEGEEVFRLAAEELVASDLAAELRVAQAFFLNLLHRYVQAIAVVQAVVARPSQERSAVAAGAQLEWGIALSLQGHQEEALHHLNEAIDLARRWQLPAVEARGQRALYRGLVTKGELSGAMAALQQALRRYQQLGYHLHEGFVYRSLGQVAWLQSQYAQSLTYYEQSLAIYQAADDQPRVMSIWTNLSEIHDALDDLGRAYRYLELAYRHREESQDPRHAANTMAGFARLMARLGEYTQAHQYGQQALALQRQLGNEAGVIEALCILGWVHFLQGNAAVALSLHQEALTVILAAHVPIHEGLALLGLGKAQAALGYTTEALAVCQQALAIQRKLGQEKWILETLSELARLHAAQGDAAEALALVEEILIALGSAALQGGREPLLVMLTCYQVLHAYNDARAHQILSETHQHLQRQAATIGDEALRQSFLHNITVNRMITALYERQQTGTALKGTAALG